MGNKSSLMLQDEEIKQISEETGFTASQIEKLYSRFAHLDRSNCGSLNKTDLMSIPELAINPLCDRLIQMFFSDCDQEDDRINFRQFMRVLATFNSTNNNANASISNNGYGTGVNNHNLYHHQHHHHSSKNIATSIQGNNNTTRLQQPAGDSTNRVNNDDNNEPIDKSNNSNILDGINDSLKNKLLFVFRIYDADNDGRISFNDLRSILKMMVGNHIEDAQLDKIANRAFVEVDIDNDGYIEFSEFCKVFSGKDLNDKLRVKFLN